MLRDERLQPGTSLTSCGFPKLQTLVAKHAQKESLEEALLEELYSFVGEGWKQEDDITLLTLRRFK